MKKSWILSLGVFLSLFFTMTAWAGVSEMVDLLVWADTSGQPIPVLSKTNPNLDPETAYEVQKGYVKSRMAKDRAAGFKAGLTTEGGQKAFGVTSPLTGILYESGKLGALLLWTEKPFGGWGLRPKLDLS